MPRTDKVVVLVTCSRRIEARRIAKELVTQRLAACVNGLEAPVHSIYRWKGKIESAAEYLLLIKTARRLLPRVRECVVRMHAYEVPEFIALPIVSGSPQYLKWLADCLVGSRHTRPKR